MFGSIIGGFCNLSIVVFSVSISLFDASSEFCVTSNVLSTLAFSVCV